jgi:hypothetical protein
VVLAVVIMWSTLVAKRKKKSPPSRFGTSSLTATLQSEELPDIMLQWAPATGTYNIAFVIGDDGFLVRRPTMHAAFDTGSAHFIVASKHCKTCNKESPKYDSPAHLELKDEQRDGVAPCQTSVMYVSQSDTIRMFSDTLNITKTVGKAPGTPATTITIRNFPVGGIVAHSGASSMNVFGMSGVVTSKRNGKNMFVTPACQLSGEPQFESAMLQAVVAHGKGTHPLLWSIQCAANRRDGATVAFGKKHGTGVAYTPAVRVLPDAPSELAGTPWRYYVVEVVHARTLRNNIPLPRFPKYLLVDTATTQFLVPSETTSTDTLRGHGLKLTLAGDVTLQWASSTADDDGDTPMFEGMSSSTASNFSKDLNVGIMGALAMRGMYIEFGLEEPRTIGFST